MLCKDKLCDRQCEIERRRAEGHKGSDGGIGCDKISIADAK